MPDDQGTDYLQMHIFLEVQNACHLTYTGFSQSRVNIGYFHFEYFNKQSHLLGIFGSHSILALSTIFLSYL